MTRLGSSAGIAILLLLAPTASRAAIFTFPDPVGDTLGKGPVQLDITSVIANVGGGNLGFTVNFASAVSPLSKFASNSVIGNINIDTKLQASTADLLTATDFGGTLNPAKVGYFVDLQSEGTHAGSVDLINTATLLPVATVPISFATDSFFLSLPLTALGNSNGQVNFGVNVGTVPELTDQFVGSTASGGTGVVPEPGGLAIWCLTVAVGAILAWRCKPATRGIPGGKVQRL